MLVLFVFVAGNSGYGNNVAKVSPSSAFNTPCAGSGTAASEGAFSTGYSYVFSTTGNTVNVSVTLLDSDKAGVVAYLRTQAPFSETSMVHGTGLTFTGSIPGQNAGNTIGIAVKFAYAGGMAVTQYINYVVGENCTGGGTDTQAPTGFTASVGTVTANSVQLLLNGSDDSGNLTYTVTHGSSTTTFNGTSGVQLPVVINNLTAGTAYSFNVTAADAAGNAAANNPIALSATTAQAPVNTACAGTATAASEGAFSTGYSYAFSTTGTTVNVSVTLLDTDKAGVVAFLRTQTPFSETAMAQGTGLTFTGSIGGQAPGSTIGIAVKFAYAGGMAVTQYINYVVGENCTGGGGDTQAPTGFTATAGIVTANSVQLLLNGTDDSGSVIYTISYGSQTTTVTGTSGTQQVALIEGLTAGTAYTFSVTAADAAGNAAANNPISVAATTLQNSSSLPCTGTGTAASEGAFSTGYSYSIQTVNGNVNVSFTMLDTDKAGVVAFLRLQAPFAETAMTNTGGLTFTGTIAGQAPGSTIGIAVKFAYAGGMSVTQYIPYVVGQDCQTQQDTEAPANFTATAGTITANSVQLLLNGTDNSGSVTYTITYGTETETVTVTGGAQQAYIVDGLMPQTAYSFSVTAADAAGNAAANNPIVIAATTLATADTQAPTGFTATAGTITANSVALVLNAADNSGSVTFTITYGTETETVTVTGGTQQVYVVDGLTAETAYSFSITAADAAGNQAANPIVVTATTLEDSGSSNTPCAGTSTEASEGSFSTGYTYEFETVGTTVNVTITMLDTDKEGVVAYLRKEMPFSETAMTNTGGLTFTGSFTGQVVDSTIGIAVKFAYAGGMAVTEYIDYVVGENCGGGGEEDTEAPTGFTAIVGTIATGSVQLLLNATDNSGDVIYTITYGDTTITVTGVSGEEESVVINGLDDETGYTFTITATDAAGNVAANNPIVLQATTLEDTNTECEGTSAVAQQGTFSTGYTYHFETVGNDVVITFELLDTDREGVVAFAWLQDPFTETQMVQGDGLTYSVTIPGLPAGEDKNFAVKFAYAGGQSVTQYFTYTVGENCTMGTVRPEFGTSLKMFPNPASSIITLDAGQNEISKVEIFSLLGAKVLETTQTAINVESLSKGIYMVKVSSGNAFVTKKLVVE